MKISHYGDLHASARQLGPPGHPRCPLPGGAVSTCRAAGACRGCWAALGSWAGALLGGVLQSALFSVQASLQGRQHPHPCNLGSLHIGTTHTLMPMRQDPSEAALHSKAPSAGARSQAVFCSLRFQAPESPLHAALSHRPIILPAAILQLVVAWVMRDDKLVIRRSFGSESGGEVAVYPSGLRSGSCRWGLASEELTKGSSLGVVPSCTSAKAITSRTISCTA